MTLPLISIITPLYNSEAFIEATIHSVMYQDYENWEMLIVDDCSTDNGPTIAKRYASRDPRIKLLENDVNSGVAATRNKGLDNARGELICFLDSDDLWKSNKLSSQVNVYLKTKANFIISDYDQIDESEKYLSTYKCPKQLDFKNLLRGSFIGCLTVMVTRELIGSSRFKKKFHEDYLMWLELFSKPAIAPVAIQEPLASYRIRSVSLSSNKMKAAKHQWKIYRKEIGLNFYQASVNFVFYIIRGIAKHFF
jgi:teichuronic acid biosynthesis glycosyltransferase TuaG